MRLHDVRNAERARFLIFSAKNCCVFGAENVKNRRRKRGNLVSKFSCSLDGSARREEDEQSLTIAILSDVQRRTRAVGEFCAENCNVFDAENLKIRRRKCNILIANRFGAQF